VPESDLLADIIGLCEELGLLVFHSADSRRDTGRGFPDLVIVSRTGKRIIFAELKDWNRDLSEHQVTWKYSLLANGADWRLWKPNDWPQIESALRKIV
jgi:hypothetical protein